MGGGAEGSKFEFNEYNNLKCDLLVVDEASMVRVVEGCRRRPQVVEA
jgi:ATP-dependent exoDNAse (exonuclease V) alpha subunit